MSIDINFNLVDDLTDKFSGYSEMYTSGSAPLTASSRLPNTIFSIQIFQTSRLTRTVVPLNRPTQSELKIQHITANRKITPKDVSGRVDITVSWGGDDGVKTEVSVSGSAEDNKGNSVEVSATHDSDGKTSVSISAERDKDK